MSKVNNQGYVEVKQSSKKAPGNKGSYRNFWIGRRVIPVGNVHLKRKYWGKRIRLKLEEVDSQ